MLTLLALAACGDFRTDCDSPLGDADRNCDGRDDADQDGDGSPADLDCDDSRADLVVDDPDGDGFSTCTGDCDETSEDAAIRGPRGVVVEDCDDVDNDCNDVIDEDDAGRSACAIEALFVRPDRVQLDLLFVVDSSGSMVEEQGLLPAAGLSFLPYLVGTDTHLGVISNHAADQGHLHGASGGPRYLDLADQDEESARAWWVEAADLDPAGGFPNTGMDAAYFALDPNHAGGSFNLGFRRPEAYLAVVFVSDSDDASTVREVETFVPWLDALDGELGATTTAHGILSTDITACAGLAEVATDYQEAVLRTGGTVSSVCEPEWGSAVARIATAEAPESVVRLTLGPIPIPATLSATVHTVSGLTDIVDAGGLVYEPAPVEPHVLVPQHRWVDLESVELTYEVLPANWPR